VGEPHRDDQGEAHHQRGPPQDKPPPEVTSTAASPIFFDVGTPNTCKPPETSVRSHPAPLFVHPHLATETCTLIPEPTGLCCGGEGGITALGKHARDTQQGGLGGVPVTPGHMRTHEQHAHGAHTKGGHIGIANETPFSSSPEPASPYHFSRVVQKDMLEALPDAHHEGGPRSTLPVAHREGGSGSTLHDGMFSDDPDGIDTDGIVDIDEGHDSRHRGDKHWRLRVPHSAITITNIISVGVSHIISVSVSSIIIVAVT